MLENVKNIHHIMSVQKDATFNILYYFSVLYFLRYYRVILSIYFSKVANDAKYHKSMILS